MPDVDDQTTIRARIVMKRDGFGDHAVHEILIHESGSFERVAEIRMTAANFARAISAEYADCEIRIPRRPANPGGDVAEGGHADA